MPTNSRRAFAQRAIHYFLEQDHENIELLIVDDGSESVAYLIPDDPRIRYIRLNERLPLGAKRNLACREARGEIIVHWDDDDWMAPWRLSYQVNALIESQADICGLNRLLFYNPFSDQAWRYSYPPKGRSWLAGGTLCYRKSFWESHPFPHVQVGEDSRFIWSKPGAKLLAQEKTGFYVAIIHPGNTSPKRTQDPRYRSWPVSDVRNLLGADWNFYAELARERKATAGAQADRRFA
jgi:glycosyltransferase involved in cell wall biosynthesis